jgi:hypothetical protein
MNHDSKLRAKHEMDYCEAILAKSKTSVLLKTLPATDLSIWKHYPEQEVFDAATGAQWYYHCHDDSDALGEHGHYHCFVRPEGTKGPACHLIAIGVNARGKITRLFTVNQWVVGGEWFDAETTNRLIENFNVELAHPDYLVNRWLTAAVSYYEDDIIQLNRERDEALNKIGGPVEATFNDRTYEVLSELKIR